MRRNLIAGAFVFAAALPAAAQDILRFRDPKRNELQVEVSNLNYKVIEYDIDAGVNKVRQTADSKDVAEIVIDTNRMTFEYAQAHGSYSNGSYQDAVERFERVKRDTRAPELQKQTAAINVVKCYWAMGDIPKALAAIAQLRQEKPDSFYLRDSFELEVKCHLAKNDHAAATKAVGMLEERGKSDGMPEWTKTADVLRGGLFEIQGKWREALSTHRKYLRDKDVGEEATLGELRCLKELQDTAGLNARAESILSEAKGKKGYNPRLLTAAFNARGESKLAAGKAKDALLDFMQGVEVLNKGGDSSREHETAIARAAVACAAHAAGAKDKSEKDLYKLRAMELQDQLKRFYGAGSSHMKDIQEAIAKVK